MPPTTYRSNKRIPDVLISKLNTFMNLVSNSNPKVKNDTDLKLIKRRTKSTIDSIYATKFGFRESLRYINGMIFFEKKRLSFINLFNSFESYVSEINVRIPNMPHAFQNNIWDLVLNQALVKDEQSALILLDNIKAKNLETLNSKSEEE